jgi:pyruvate dehydrogenase phosphatase
VSRDRSSTILRLILKVWDRITSEEAVLLTAAYLRHPSRDAVTKGDLPVQIPIKTSDYRPYPVQDLPGSPSRRDGKWTFEGDSNVATHLIRNSLAGADLQKRGELLSLHGKVSRWMRDDITVS